MGKDDIPDISYHHQYFVQLVFDETQVAKVLDKPSKVTASKPVVSDKAADRVVKEQVKTIYTSHYCGGNKLC